MTEVFWLEQNEADVPPENDWLSPAEMLRLRGLRFAKRRADWRLGRWTAKRALAICLKLRDDPQALAEMEIRVAPSGAPEVILGHQRACTSISLSHCSSMAVCAVAPAGTALGCDLERIEPRSDAFVADYFSPEEQALVAYSSPAERPEVLTLFWSGKESALKALQAGLRLDTRSVIVNSSGSSCCLDGWHPLRVCHRRDQVFYGWWQHSGDFVKTMVSAPPSLPPIRLPICDQVASCTTVGTTKLDNLTR